MYLKKVCLIFYLPAILQVVLLAILRYRPLNIVIYQQTLFSL
nr:MAG TPA: hypothetical protein [Caudoviricetes sp.]